MQPTSKMDVTTNNNLETRPEGTPPAEPKRPRQPERVTQTGNANLLEMMRTIMEETLTKNIESLKEDNKKSGKRTRKIMNY